MGIFIRVFKWTMAIAIIVVGVGLSMLNFEATTFNYFWGSVQLPISMLLFAAFAGGALIGIASGLKWITQLKLKQAKLQRDYELAKEELEKLRIMPIKNTP